MSSTFLSAVMSSSRNNPAALGQCQDNTAKTDSGIHRGYGCSRSARLGLGTRRGGITISKKLIIGLRYRVDGILHEYLGPALLPGGTDVAHVFLRNEWRPNTLGQLPLTLVDETGLDESVAKARIGGSGAHRYRRMRTRWE